MTQSIEPLTQPARLDLTKLNQRFEKASPRDILRWCVVNLPIGLVQASPFNVDDLMITDLLYRDLQPASPVPILFLDTLHHFPDTLDLVAQAKDIYHLDLKICKPLGVKNRKEFTAKYGEMLWQTDVVQFHGVTKIEPLQQGLAELGAIAWITGHRRDQSPIRAKMPVFELDVDQRLKVNPLASWTRRETWAYVFEHDVIYNPLHDQGFSSIGDEPLTNLGGKSINALDSEWLEFDKNECGI